MRLRLCRRLSGESCGIRVPDGVMSGGVVNDGVVHGDAVVDDAVIGDGLN
jgi:hypothetical protein